MLLEEAKAMREQQKRKQQHEPQTTFYFTPEAPSQPQQPYPQDQRNQSGVVRNQPTPPPLPPKVQNTQDSQLTMSDLHYAAMGVGQKIKQFDQDYGVSEKCKIAANACVNKAKELDQEYEVFGVLSLDCRYDKRRLIWAIK